MLALKKAKLSGAFEHVSFLKCLPDKNPRSITGKVAQGKHSLASFKKHCNKLPATPA